MKIIKMKCKDAVHENLYEVPAFRKYSSYIDRLKKSGSYAVYYETNKDPDEDWFAAALKELAKQTNSTVQYIQSKNNGTQRYWKVSDPLFKLLEAIFELIVPLVMAEIIDKGIGNNDKKYILLLLLFNHHKNLKKGF